MKKQRFNEAGANWPRNCRLAMIPAGNFDASMRPGPIGPGIDYDKKGKVL